MSAQEDVNGLLAGASKTIAGARSCWLVTSTGDGGVDARVGVHRDASCGLSVEGRAKLVKEKREA